jgi:hypothetical protein
MIKLTPERLVSMFVHETLNLMRINDSADVPEIWKILKDEIIERIKKGDEKNNN